MREKTDPSRNTDSSQPLNRKNGRRHRDIVTSEARGYTISHMAHSTNNSVWDTLTTILSSFDADANGSLDREEFHALCIELFGTKEVKQHEQKAREIFKFFDADADGTLNERELQRCYKWIRATVKPVNVLLVVDVQNDLINGVLRFQICGCGQNGAEVLEPINQILKDGHWDKVIYTQDYHPENHISFFEDLALRELHPKSKVTRETAKPFDIVIFQSGVTQRLLPKHCVMNTWGAELHKDLLIVPSSERVYKGRNPDKDANGAFDSNDDPKTGCTDYSSGLNKILSNIGATHLYVCGLTYDVNVKETCLGGLSLGYRVAVINDCCRGPFPNDTMIAKKLICENGGLIADSDRILSLVNEDGRSLVMAHHAAKNIM